MLLAIVNENYVSAIEDKIPEWLVEFKDVTDKRVLWDKTRPLRENKICCKLSHP